MWPCSPLGTTVGAPVVAAPAKKSELILLLMSKISFELVHAEVNVETARVSDVLNLIPQLASQESVKRQSYIGLCDYKNERTLDSKMLISEVCNAATSPSRPEENSCSSAHIRVHTASATTNVVVALPNDLFVRECARRARNILKQVVPKVCITSLCFALGT